MSSDNSTLMPPAQLEYLAAKSRKLLDELLAEDELSTRGWALRAPDALELIEKRASDGSMTPKPLERHRSSGHIGRRANGS